MPAAIDAYTHIPPPVNLSYVPSPLSADEVVKRLANVFEQFMSTLADNEEIGMALASFGVEHTIHVQSVRALGPSLICITGFENGAQVQLVQHLSQLSFLLIRVEPASPDGIPRRKIGFAAE